MEASIMFLSNTVNLLAARLDQALTPVEPGSEGRAEELEPHAQTRDPWQWGGRSGGDRGAGRFGTWNGGAQAETPPSQRSGSERSAGAGRGRGVIETPRSSGTPARNSSLGREEQETERRPIPFKAEFDGDPDKLAFFLTTTRGFMADFGKSYPHDPARVRAIGARLRGGAGEWFVQRYENQDPCLQTLEGFLEAVRKRFADPNVQLRRKGRLQALRQGPRAVREYAAEFRTAAEVVPEWSDETKLELFKRGLRPDILDTAEWREDPDSLEEWIQLAGRVEAFKEKRQLRRREMGSVRSAPAPKPTSNAPKPLDRGQREGAPASNPSHGAAKKTFRCFTCDKEGHRAAMCPQRKSPRSPADSKRSDGRAATTESTEGEEVESWEKERAGEPVGNDSDRE